MTANVNDSQFHMWRTLFAITHADNIVTDDEVKFMAHVLEDVNFSAEQERMLKDDIMNAKDIEEMFRGVTDHSDREKFFQFARDIVWVDGEYAPEEQAAMVRLLQMHYEDKDIDSMVGTVQLELEDETPYVANTNSSNQNINTLSSFQRFFKKWIIGE